MAYEKFEKWCEGKNVKHNERKNVAGLFRGKEDSKSFHTVDFLFHAAK
jgi:hypothetical protein